MREVDEAALQMIFLEMVTLREGRTVKETFVFRSESEKCTSCVGALVDESSDFFL